MGTAVKASTGQRVQGIDRLRGAAILLMVLDHVLVHVDYASPLRFTATRLALPAFVICAALVRPVGAAALGRRRMLLLAGAVCAEAVLGPAAGLGTPGPVLLITLVLVAAPQLDRAPATFAVLGLIQALYLAPRFGPHWDGYQPGMVAAWWCVGRLVTDRERAWTEHLPRPLAVVGRHPLAWYLGHLAVIALVWPT